MGADLPVGFLVPWPARCPGPAPATRLPGDEAAAPGKGAASAGSGAEGAVRLGSEAAKEHRWSDRHVNAVAISTLHTGVVP